MPEIVFTTLSIGLKAIVGAGLSFAKKKAKKSYEEHFGDLIKIDRNLGGELQKAARKAQFSATVLACESCLVDLSANRKEEIRWFNLLIKSLQEKIKDLPNTPITTIINDSDSLTLFQEKSDNIQEILINRFQKETFDLIQVETDLSSFSESGFTFLKLKIEQGWEENSKPTVSSSKISWFGCVCKYFQQEYLSNHKLTAEIQKHHNLVTVSQLNSIVDKVSVIDNIHEFTQQSHTSLKNIEKCIVPLSEKEKQEIADKAVQEYLSAQKVDTTKREIIGDLIARDFSFVDRLSERKHLLQLLTGSDNSIRENKMIVLNAASGYGKTSLITELLHEVAPNGKITSGLTKGILIFYFREKPVTLRDICAQADSLLGDNKTVQLTANYDLYKKNEKTLTGVISDILLELKTLGEVWLYFDNFENALDGTVLIDSELNEFFIKSLTTANSLHFLLTSQKIPQFKTENQIEQKKIKDAINPLTIPELPCSFAKEFLLRKGSELKDRGIDCGLAEADDQILDVLLEKITSAPMALVSFVGYLETVCQTIGSNLKDVLADDSLFIKFRSHDAKTGIIYLIKRQFLSHNKREQTVLKAISIFPKPVPFPILKFILRSFDTEEILSYLLNLSLVRRIGNNSYELLPQIKEVISNEFDDKDILSLRELNNHAVDFYQSVRKSPEECETLEDFEPQFSIMHHLYQARRYNEAAVVITGDEDELIKRKGYTPSLIQERIKLLGKVTEPFAKASNLGNLGSSYIDAGDSRKVIFYSLQSLSIWKILGSKFAANEGTTLYNIGCAYKNLSKFDMALKHHERSLEIFRFINQPHKQAIVLGHIGNVFLSMGDLPIALKYYEQSLDLIEYDDKNLGIAYSQIGTVLYKAGIFVEAKNFLSMALIYLHKSGFKVFENRILGLTGIVEFKLGNKEDALKMVSKALEFARQVKDISDENKWFKALEEIKESTIQ